MPILHQKKYLEHLDLMRRGLEAQKRAGGAPSKGVCTTHALSSLGPPIDLILSPTDFI
jgi:hypothetical protein